MHSLSIINLFIGDHDLMGNDTLGYYIDVYLNFVLIFLFAFSIIYICIKYLFKEYSVFSIYGITLSIIVPIFLWHFYPYLLDKSYILRSDDSLLYKRLLYFDFLPLFFILYYGFVLYKHDWSLGEHINTIMVCFFIMVLMDVTNMLGYIYKITIFPLTQYVLLLILTFFLITLFKRLNHTYSEFGQFYDKLVVSGNTMGVPIKRKKDAYVSLIDFAKSYFYQRRNTLGFITLLTVFCVNYFDVSPFLKLNLVAISLGILVLFFYLTALYQKRIQKGRLLNVNRSS
ncbi:MAG: hypothetical protein ACE5HO_06915 [bacterium]